MTTETINEGEFEAAARARRGADVPQDAPLTLLDLACEYHARGMRRADEVPAYRLESDPAPFPAPTTPAHEVPETPADPRFARIDRAVVAVRDVYAPGLPPPELRDALAKILEHVLLTSDVRR
jgi:hypothetical protein